MNGEECYLDDFRRLVLRRAIRTINKLIGNNFNNRSEEYALRHMVTVIGRIIETKLIKCIDSKIREEMVCLERLLEITSHYSKNDYRFMETSELVVFLRKCLPYLERRLTAYL
ncbi:MAG: hypothetical protein DRO12_03120 [Thermoprotei archaeon]|nr:MAG: hypothetical protein DRO12_03120 [Thermoprotei archaeon]